MSVTLELHLQQMQLDVPTVPFLSAQSCWSQMMGNDELAEGNLFDSQRPCCNDNTIYTVSNVFTYFIINLTKTRTTEEGANRTFRTSHKVRHWAYSSVACFDALCDTSKIHVTVFDRSYSHIHYRHLPSLSIFF